MHSYPAAGDEVGPYRIQRRLGDSDHGVLYAATQGAGGREVALRVLSADAAEDTVARRRVTRAARAAASVQSPHVALVYLYGEDKRRRMYVASELVTGDQLGHVLRHQGAAPVHLGLQLMAQVATGLSAIHSTGVLHGGLTPANVLVQWRAGTPTAVLGDIGVSRSVTAPEVHLGEQPGVASDVHSLGALVWTTLTGEPVHQGSDFQVAEAFVRDPVPQLQGRSPQVRHLNELLAKAMHRDPARRHASALELRDDLVAALALPGEAGPLRRRPVVVKGPDRRTTVTTTVAALLLMLVGLVAGTVLLFSSF
ncbi:hypothetical protein DDE18_01135 [Nocardioides gansuensis]|uniref:non-specific serine/threonine protein kinase n=1 Tax=Nocardioides gansuensis TaxID=2138300 RepID=A0A2T8FEZ9_9ACTN|nr:serine/threonine-protein kinase [Nocardioides gansuensis]PVG84267.1 hypothetical protein DDE18_01135 [Nocardioides gansuensis]